MIVLAVMSKMRSSSLLALVAGLVACDRPTAPQARDAIEAEQHVLLHSDAWRVGPRLGSLFEHITMSGWIRASPCGSLAARCSSPSTCFRARSGRTSIL